MAAGSLSDKEALKMAMELEEVGRDFYLETAGASKGLEAKEMFKKLADAELDHYNLFKELLESSQFQEELYNQDVSDYLRNLVDTVVFNKIDKPFKKWVRGLSEIEALSIGIQAERDSILFYNQAAATTGSAKSKDVFDKLADIEKEHFALLSGQLRIARKLF